MMIQKSEWKSGPWHDEEDHYSFKYKGYQCHMLRNRLGAWCGYVGISHGSKLYEIDYDQEPISSFDVHGGITYSGGLASIYWQDDLNDDLYYIGFDCSHSWDINPGYDDDFLLNHKDCPEELRQKLKEFSEIQSQFKSMLSKKESIYRDVKFVKKEIRKLVRQIIKAENE